MSATGSLLLRSAVLFALAVVAGSAARGQLLEPAKVNLFGDEFVKTLEIQKNGGIVFNGNPTPPSNEGFENLLQFQNGQQIRGRMVSVDKDEIIWKRPDFSEPLHLKKDGIRRVFLTPENAQTNRFGVNGGQILILDGRGRRTLRNVTQAGVIPATIKLSGEDWLYGQVSSTDGQNFVLRTDDKGGSLTAPRSEVEWIYFDPQPARGGGFDGSLTGMEEWLAAAPSATLTKDGLLHIPHGNEFFGRALPQPRYFEVAFEVTADTEQGSHLWLEPFGPTPNAFGMGTVDVEFGPKELAVRRFVNNMDEKKLPLRDPSAPDARGMVLYRVFYDSEEQRLMIFRNGKLAVDWAPDPQKQDDAQLKMALTQMSDFWFRSSQRTIAQSSLLTNALAGISPNSAGFSMGFVPATVTLANQMRTEAQFLTQRARSMHPRILGICITGGLKPPVDGEQSMGDLKLGRFRVNPWDGRVPKEGERELTEDLLTSGDKISVKGALEKITDKEIVISQQATPKSAGMLLRLPKPTPVPFDPVARVDLGALGELSAAGLSIGAGKVHIKAAFSDDVEIPSTSLNSIYFKPSVPEAENLGDVLVFKNGDELPGSFLDAPAGGPVRWKLTGGQEAQVEVKNLAGMRLGSRKAANANATGTLAELRNGDRIRGAIASFDAQGLGIKNPSLGALSVDRQKLWRLYPSPAATIRDGSDDPHDWMASNLRAMPNFYRNPGKKTLSPDQAWLHFDGCYIPRQTRRQNGEIDQNLLCSAVPHQESGLFEVRADITGTGGNPPNGMIAVGGKNAANTAQPSVFVNFSYAEMYVNVMTAQGQKSRQIPFGAKLGKISTRLSLRIFVNSVLGTVDIMLDGALLARVGQQADERAPGISEVANVGGLIYDGNPIVISNLWIGPWDGELPRAEAIGRASTTFANGDATEGVPVSLKDGVYHLDTDVGPIELPAANVSAISFGGQMAPQHCAVRLRLTDGSIIHAASYDCRDGVMNAQSETFGEIHLPVEDLSEIVLDPAPIRPPKEPLPKRPVDTAEASGRNDSKPDEKK